MGGDGAAGSGDDDLAPGAVLFDLLLHPLDIRLGEAGVGDEDPVTHDVGTPVKLIMNIGDNTFFKFAEVFLNGKYIGCYFVCEKIEVKKNRLELSSKSYLLEFDTHYDADYKFRTSINDLPVNIKYPKEIDDSSFSFIQNYIDSIETVLQQKATSLEYLEYINQESFADYLIVYAMANNSEPMMPKSVFMHKDGEGKLNAGPVWDFDYATFNIEKTGISNRNSAIFKK